MGPRRFSRGNNVCLVYRSGFHFSLQWGRGVSAAEMRIGASIRPPRHWASMGPRRFSRGNHSKAWIRCCLRTRFNGAAAFQPRKSVQSALKNQLKLVLQWGRGVSAAEMGVHGKRTETPTAASMGPRRFSRGNRDATRRTGDMASASMGPRRFSRGNLGVAVVTGTSTCRFNGAAAFQPRKSYCAGIFTRATQKLQWGRGVSAAEIRYWRLTTSRLLSFNGAAAFQPRKSRHPCDIHRPPIRFNGAAAFQPRKSCSR